jgi:site-specific DNA-methyltransferase (adenine-specific)
MPELFRGDCLAVMDRIPDGSVDMILCDLPYGTTACKWDSVIPFEPLWAHYRRVIKRGGAIVLTASQPFTSALVMSNPEWFKYCLVWRKNLISNFFNARHQPGKVHEDIVVFSPAAASHSANGSMAYFPERRPGAPWVKHETGIVCAHAFHTPKRAGLRQSDGGRLPVSVLEFPSERGLHPTQKPVALMAYLIRTYTRPGEVVLDNCMGSGTTGVACVETGREFIGIERDPGYFRTAKRRIAAAERAQEQAAA